MADELAVEEAEEAIDEPAAEASVPEPEAEAETAAADETAEGDEQAPA